MQSRLTENAVTPVAILAEQLGFAPIALGSLNDGGSLVQARGDTWGKLIFKDLVKFK
jgi:predicted dinucleotide-binding enzyme